MRLLGRAALRNLRGCHDRGTHVWLHWAAYWSVEMVVVISTSYTLSILSGTDGSSREPIHATAILRQQTRSPEAGAWIAITDKQGYLPSAETNHN